MERDSEGKESTPLQGLWIQTKNMILGAWTCTTLHTKNAQNALGFMMNRNVLLYAPWTVVWTIPTTGNQKNSFWPKRHSCTCDAVVSSRTKLSRGLLTVGLVAIISVSCKSQTAFPRQAIESACVALREAPSDGVRLERHEALKEIWRQWLTGASVEDAFAFEPASLQQTLGIVDAGKGPDQIRIISWNVELSDRTHRYGGFVILPTGWTELNHDERMRDRDVLDDQRRFRPDDWPGAIYYDVVIEYRRGRAYHLLLGWQGADALTTRKFAEGLEIQRGRIRFGAPWLEVDGRRTKRYHLIYGDDVSATLRQEESTGRIVMDHLSAPSAELTGFHHFYGPDFTYDAFIWEKDTWQLVRNIEVIDPSQNRPWIDPNPRKRRRQSQP